METRAHDAVQYGIGDCSNRHALVVRHEGAHQAELATLRHTAGREVQRFMKTVAAPGADGGQFCEVAHGGPWINHGCQSGGVGRDDQIILKAAFEPEARDAEV